MKQSLDRREKMKRSSTRDPKDPSTEIPSFFKIMIGDDFSEILYLPPRFARTVSNLINQKFVLEDANGMTWMVTLSKNKGSLAFVKGWNDFSSDHGLEIGDLVAFKILKQTHFLVSIYGRSACEEVLFPKTNGNKRKRKRTNDISNEKFKNFTETGSDNNVHVQQSNSSALSVRNIEVNKESHVFMDNTSNTDDRNNLVIVSKSNLEEEPFYMINRDVKVIQGETRDLLYDLASIEMSSCDVSKSGNRVLENEKFQQCNDKILNLESEVKTVEEIPVAKIPNLESEASTVEETPVAKEIQSCLPIPKVPKFETMGKSKDIGNVDKGTRLANNDSKSKIAQEHYSNRGSGKELRSVYRRQHIPTRMSGQKAENKSGIGLDFSDLGTSPKLGVCSTGKSLKQVKQEKVEMKETCFREGIPATGKDLKRVKQEQIEIIEEALVHGGKSEKSFDVVEQKQVEREQEGFVHGGTPGYQWMMKLDEDSYPSIEINNNVLKTVKDEPVDTIDFISNVTLKVKIPNLETPDKQPYLELPDSLVPNASKTRTKPRSFKTFVIYLRGPKTGLSMRPVLYLEKPGRKLISSGWDAFRKANGIVAGDECVFKREDQYELIFRVTVLPK